MNLPKRVPATTPTTEDSVKETVSSFVEDHDDGWTFEEETSLREGWQASATKSQRRNWTPWWTSTFAPLRTGIHRHTAHDSAHRHG